MLFASVFDGLRALRLGYSALSLKTHLTASREFLPVWGVDCHIELCAMNPDSIAHDNWRHVSTLQNIPYTSIRSTLALQVLSQTTGHNLAARGTDLIPERQIQITHTSKYFTPMASISHTTRSFVTFYDSPVCFYYLCGCAFLTRFSSHNAQLGRVEL